MTPMICSECLAPIADDEGRVGVEIDEILCMDCATEDLLHAPDYAWIDQPIKE